MQCMLFISWMEMDTGSGWVGVLEWLRLCIGIGDWRVVLMDSQTTGCHERLPLPFSYLTSLFIKKIDFEEASVFYSE